MKGIIAAINPVGGMVAIQTENYGYSIFELLSNEDIEIGDEVFWQNDTGLGREHIKNLRSGLVFEVYFQNHWVSSAMLEKQLLF